MMRIANGSFLVFLVAGCMSSNNGQPVDAEPKAAESKRATEDSPGDPAPTEASAKATPPSGKAAVRYRRTPSTNAEAAQAEALWKKAAQEKDAARAVPAWEKTAEAFTAVAKRQNLTVAVRKNAAYAAVLAWKNAISMVPSPALAPASQSQAPRTMSPRIQKLLGAFALYESVVTDPKDTELRMMTFLRGRLYWRHNRFGDAIPVFEQIVRSHPSTNVGEYSANLLLDSLNRTKRYAEMERWVTAMLGNQKLLSGRADLRSRLLLLQKQINRTKAP